MMYYEFPGNKGISNPPPSSMNRPGPSSGSSDLPGTSSGDNTTEDPDKPYVSRYGIKEATHLKQDIELYRATLFNLKTEPEEDRERRYAETARLFLIECLKPQETAPEAGDLQPEETVLKIKSKPIDATEEDTSFSYGETEQHGYLPEFYSEPNSSHIDITTNFNGNELDINLLQQYEEEMDEMDFSMPLVAAPVLPVPLEPEEEINETNTQLVEPETIEELSTMIETSAPIDTTTYPRANELSTRMFLQQHEEEMDEMDFSTPLVADPVLPVPLEPEKEINETNTQLVEPETIEELNTMTETSAPIDTTTYPRANELSTRMFLQQHEEEMDEMDFSMPIVADPVLPVPLELEEEINETNTQLVEPETIEELNTVTETSAPIDTTTNPGASVLDDGNTNIIVNLASVQKKTRKKKDVISTPTRFSTRIKKPRIMFDI